MNQNTIMVSDEHFSKIGITHIWQMVLYACAQFLLDRVLVVVTGAGCQIKSSSSSTLVTAPEEEEEEEAG